MALDTTSHDLYRGTSGLSLPTDLSNEVITMAAHESAIMQLATRVDLPGRGVTIPVITSDPVAAFVNEAAEKPVSNSTLSTMLLKPYKLAAIELVSNELMRDVPRLYDELIRRLPVAIAKAFDTTVFNGTAPGTGFTTLADASSISIDDGADTTTYKQLVSVLETVSNEDAALTGWAISPQGRAKLLGATDTTGRPIFASSITEDAVERLLGARVVDAPYAYSSTAGVVGFAGDWSKARWGIVDDIDIAISDQATVNDGTNQINLWQRNMTAIRVECECGFVADSDMFVKLTTSA